MDDSDALPVNRTPSPQHGGYINPILCVWRACVEEQVYSWPLPKSVFECIIGESVYLTFEAGDVSTPPKEDLSQERR